MNEKLKQLYREVILQHNARPYHFAKQQSADVIIEANNPLCGDRFSFYIDLENDQIQTAGFYGFGCAISKASASLLVGKLEGKSIVEALAFTQEFLEFLDGQHRETFQDELLEAFAAVDEFPARKECAQLGWLAINKYLSESNLSR